MTTTQTATEDDIRYAVEHRTCLPPESLTSELLRAAGCERRVFLLPGDMRERKAYMADVLVQMFGFGSPLPADMKLIVGRLCQSLSYLVNSQSWTDNELHDFDRDEIARKLKPLTKSAD